MNKAKIYKNSKDEWYTPLSVIEYVKKEMGGITLDPATTEKNAELMGIPNFYTKETNGLDKCWQGHKVWLNPPFSNKWEWVKKAREEVEKGNCKVFLLLPMSFETQLYHHNILGKSIIHIPNRRISFVDGNSLIQKKDIPFTSVSFELETMNSSPFGSCLIELKKEPNSTYKVFNIPKRGKQ